MDLKKNLPAFLLALAGFGLVAWSFYIIVTNRAAASLTDFKSQFVFIIAGILLIGFAVYYLKNGDQYASDSEEMSEDVEIIWETEEKE